MKIFATLLIAFFTLYSCTSAPGKNSECCGCSKKGSSSKNGSSSSKDKKAKGSSKKDDKKPDTVKATKIKPMPKGAKIDAEAQKVLDAVDKATHADKFKNVTSMEQTAAISIVGMNINGRYLVKTQGNKLFVSSVVANMKDTTGFDGKTAWSNSMITGLRFLEGKEKMNLIADTLYHSNNPEKYYDEIKYLGKEKFGNAECHKLLYKKKGASDSVTFVNVKTNLPAGSKSESVSASGTQKVTTYFTKYTKHKSGFLYASHFVQQAGPTRVNIRVLKTVLNKKMDEKIFRAPAL